jgi:predicted nucleic acid-binding protein
MALTRLDPQVKGHPREACASTQVEKGGMNPAMHTLSLYLDTSVIGGYYDAEFMADTRALWQLREAGRFRFVSSELVLDEVSRAPQRVRDLLRTSFAVEEVLDITDEMEDLAAAYMAQNVVPADYADDAQHVAICSVARLDYLVSWNFKHLANVRRESGFNAVNVLQGYPPVRIVAPTFLIHGHDQEEKDL